MPKANFRALTPPHLSLSLSLSLSHTHTHTHTRNIYETIIFHLKKIKRQLKKTGTGVLVLIVMLTFNCHLHSSLIAKE